MSSKTNKKKAKFINNQLKIFFFFTFRSKTKFIYDFPTSKSQIPKDSKLIITFTKYTTYNFNIKNVSSIIE